MGGHQRSDGSGSAASEPKATPQLTDDEVRNIAERALATRVDELVPQAGSVGNQNYRVDTRRGRFALKLAAETELAAERWGLAQAGAVGVPVPRVAASAALTEGRGFLITAWVYGRPAVAESDTEALIDAGRAMRRLHRVTGAGYGRVEVAEGTGRGQHDSWAAFVDGILAGVGDLVRHEVIGAGLAERLVAAVADHRELTSWLGEGRLLHCDLKPAHLFAAEDRLAAIIDWGDTSYGDPRWDLARLRLAGDAVFAPVTEGYTREDQELEQAGVEPALLVGGIGVGSDFDRSTKCLGALLRLDALHYELMAGGDWFDAYRATLHAWLDSLARTRP